MKSDIQIAGECSMLPITEVAAGLGIDGDEIDLYGRYKAKLTEPCLERLGGSKKTGKLILVTAINPTPAGEGKTTVTVGLGEAMGKLGLRSVIALREPSLGPCFGVKGGAAGGGYAQVVPMEDLNLHFTGDLHAITAANNLLSAIIDNHIYQGNALGIDLRKIVHSRCMDMNDRALRDIVVGLGDGNGFTRQDRFVITAASEVMATLCLARDMNNLKERISRIVAAYGMDGEPITAGQLGAAGSMAALLKDAIRPNLIQTLEGTPALVHGGPFANIAHGCNSIRATMAGLQLADYCVTEAGFGSDLGAEKFCDIKCRTAGIAPAAVVIVATVKALKYNGGVPRSNLAVEDLEALKNGLPNLGRHIEIIRGFGLPVMVALNRFSTDTEAEIGMVRDYCDRAGCGMEVCEAYSKGSEGAVDLARSVVELANRPAQFAPLYVAGAGLKTKIETIASKVYKAGAVAYTPVAEKQIRRLTEQGFAGLPVCMAKTQYSLSDNPDLLGAPEGFTLTVRELRVQAGAGFVTVMTGSIVTMPGLSKHPAAYGIDVDSNGRITGLS